MNMNSLCRLCFENEGNHKMSTQKLLVEFIKRLYDIEIKNTDAYTHVCDDCRKAVGTFLIHEKSVTAGQAHIKSLIQLLPEIDTLFPELLDKLNYSCRLCARINPENENRWPPAFVEVIKKRYGIDYDENYEYSKKLCENCPGIVQYSIEHNGKVVLGQALQGQGWTMKIEEAGPSKRTNEETEKEAKKYAKNGSRIRK